MAVIEAIIIVHHQMCLFRVFNRWMPGEIRLLTGIPLLFPGSSAVSGVGLVIHQVMVVIEAITIIHIQKRMPLFQFLCLQRRNLYPALPGLS